MKPSSKIAPRPNCTQGSGKRPRQQTAAELQAHKDRVAALGCLCCEKLGYRGSPAELHHVRETVGMGQRASDRDVLPLCSAHHRGTMHGVPSIHLDRRVFIELFGTELSLLDEVKRRLT